MIHSRAPCRYLVVGIGCAALNIGLMWGFGACGVHWAIATLLAFPAVLVTGYVLHIRWTFTTTRPGWRSFGRYTLAMLTNYPLFTLLLLVLCDLAGLSPGPAAAVATGLLFAWNYFAARWAVLSARPAPATRAWADNPKGPWR